MNTVVTSRQEILEAARALAASNGLAALSIRSVAQAGGISVGSIYNYFPSKAQLVVAVVEDIWKSVTQPQGDDLSDDFVTVVRDLFERIRRGTAEYPSFFSMHAVCFAPAEKSEGRDAMNAYFAKMEQFLLRALEADVKIRPDAFSGSMTQLEFADFVFHNMLSMLGRGVTSCETLLEVIERVLY